MHMVVARVEHHLVPPTVQWVETVRTDLVVALVFTKMTQQQVGLAVLEHPDKETMVVDLDIHMPH
jgi:hypothetical protein